MTFGEYIRQRREYLGLNQEGLGGFGQTYISAIELGNKRPTGPTTINRIAKDLQLNEIRSKWLWLYSLLNEEPYGFLKKHGLLYGPETEKAVYTINEAIAEYSPGNSNDSRIILGETPDEIIKKLGQPDKRLHFATRRKWYYHHLGVQILFEDDQVVDVVFT